VGRAAAATCEAWAVRRRCLATRETGCGDDLRGAGRAAAATCDARAADWRKVTADADSDMWIVVVAAVMTTMVGTSMRH
jgi:hypothetical protein